LKFTQKTAGEGGRAALDKKEEAGNEEDRIRDSLYQQKKRLNKEEAMAGARHAAKDCRPPGRGTVLPDN